jgi:peptidyl-tRNA hydrolase, PTH1 family
VQDELDLPPGVVRVKAGGGLAGHNGLRSLTQHLKTQDYLRVRIGVGKPPSKEAGVGHVLSKIPKAERELLDVAVASAADAVESIVVEGVVEAQRRFNGKS